MKTGEKARKLQNKTKLQKWPCYRKIRTILDPLRNFWCIETKWVKLYAIFLALSLQNKIRDELHFLQIEKSKTIDS